MKKLFLFCLILFQAVFLAPPRAMACDSCGCTLAHVSSRGKTSERAGKFFFDFNFEQMVWQKRDPALAHALHHQGHDSHDKTREEFYHFALGTNPTERITLLAELPFIVRHSLDVDSH